MPTLDIVRDVEVGKIKKRINSRTKGHQAEREIKNLLQDIVDKVGTTIGLDIIPEVTRNLDQTRIGGCDLIGIPGIALEVKRCETLKISNWWKQTLHQAQKLDTRVDLNRRHIPILCYRQNFQQWKVIMEEQHWKDFGIEVELESQLIGIGAVFPRDRKNHKIQQMRKKLDPMPIGTKRMPWKNFEQWLGNYLKKQFDRKIRLD